MSLSEPRVLDCPSCSQRHVDRGEWATKPHRTHLCEFCGYEWRPFPHYTVGVAASPVEIERDSLAQQLAAAREETAACLRVSMAFELEAKKFRRQLAAIEAPTPEDVKAVAKVLLECGVVDVTHALAPAFRLLSNRAESRDCGT